MPQTENKCPTKHYKLHQLNQGVIAPPFKLRYKNWSIAPVLNFENTNISTIGQRKEGTTTTMLYVVAQTNSTTHITQKAQLHNCRDEEVQQNSSTEDKRGTNNATHNDR